MSTSAGYHEYIRGCSVHWGEYHEYIRGHQGTSGDIVSTSGDVQYIGGYNDACGGASW